MGLLGRLVTLPVAPLQGVVWIARQLEAEAERQYYDEPAIREKLRELDVALAEGSMSESQHDAEEDVLIQRLIEARARANVRDPSW